MTDLSEPRRDAKNAAAVEEFFERELLPISRGLARRGVRLLDTAPAPAAATYYRPRARRTMVPADFEWGGATSAEQLEVALRRLWSAPQDAPLSQLAPAVARLAARLRHTATESGDVSEFVYVMY